MYIFIVNSILAYDEFLAKQKKRMKSSSELESSDEEKNDDEVAAKQSEHSGLEGPSTQMTQTDDGVEDVFDIPTKLALANRLK
jgi:hypothetical protein